MKKKNTLRMISPSSVKMFKIANRRGYAASCKQCLTEGTTPYQAYIRMNKAVRRLGLMLKPITAQAAKRLVRKNI